MVVVMVTLLPKWLALYIDWVLVLTTNYTLYWYTRDDDDGVFTCVFVHSRRAQLQSEFCRIHSTNSARVASLLLLETRGATREIPPRFGKLSPSRRTPVASHFE